MNTIVAFPFQLQLILNREPLVVNNAAQYDFHRHLVDVIFLNSIPRLTGPYEKTQDGKIPHRANLSIKKLIPLSSRDKLGHGCEVGNHNFSMNILKHWSEQSFQPISVYAHFASHPNKNIYGARFRCSYCYSK